MGKHEAFTGAQRVAKRRAVLRAQGLRTAQVWVADIADPKVREELDREVAEINASEDEIVVMQYIEWASREVMDSLPPYDWGPQGPPE